jgi:outer membrane protein assembly factor BamB
MKTFYPTAQALTLPLLVFIMMCGSCDKIQPDTSKAIVSFSVIASDGSSLDTSQISYQLHEDSIFVTLPFNTDLSSLTPQIDIQGVSISPGSGVAQNFSVPVTYTVTAADSTKASYVVLAKRKAPQAVVYVGSGDGVFQAVDALTGKVEWRYQGGGTFAYSGASSGAGMIYVGCGDSYVYAFDSHTGKIRWKFKAGSTGIESDAVAHDGLVYFGSNDDYFYAVDAMTGELAWRFHTGANVSASPVFRGGDVFFGSSDGKIYALDAASGQEKWEYATGGMINQSDPAVAWSTVYAGSRDGYAYAINILDGSLRWRYDAVGSLEMSGPAVSNGILYIGGQSGLFAIKDTSGTLLWKALDTDIDSSPAVDGTTVFITSGDGTLYALDASSGAILWDKKILSNGASPAVWNGIVFCGGGGSHYIYAFDASSGTQKWRLASEGLTNRPLIMLGYSFGL